MDCHLNFDVHIHEMYKKAMGHFLFLNTRRVKEKFESDTRKTVVESIGLSVMNYCLPVCGTTNATLLRECSNYKTSLPRYVLVERGDLTKLLLSLISCSGSK